MQLIESPVVRLISLNTEIQAFPEWNVAAVKQWTAILHKSLGQWKRTLYLIETAGELLVDRMQLSKLENVQNTRVNIHAFSSFFNVGGEGKWGYYWATLMFKSLEFHLFVPNHKKILFVRKSTTLQNHNKANSAWNIINLPPSAQLSFWVSQVVLCTNSELKVSVLAQKHSIS